MFGSFGLAVEIVGVLMVIVGAALMGAGVGKHQQLPTAGVTGPSGDSSQRLILLATVICGGGATMLATGWI